MDPNDVLHEIKETLAISEEDLANLLGEDPVAIRTWMKHGIPAEARPRLHPLAYTAQFMKEWFVEPQIPELVRQPLKELDDRSVLDMLADNPERVISYLSGLFNFATI